MKSDVSLEELLPSDMLEVAFEEVAAASDEFTEICVALGLDPAQDFRFSNLRDVDFSGADLSGFDFRGADLRGSYGTNVNFDERTNFEGADLQESCFAIYYREHLLLRDNPMATRMYRALLEGDPFEISGWLHDRFRKQRETHSILKKADQETVSILCQKLLTDDIDLTKQTDLLYFLSSITGSRAELRELMLSIFARKSENTLLIEKFTTVAASLYRDDADVRGFIIQLCASKAPSVRLSAFKASANTGIFLQHFETMKKLFLSPNNRLLRKQIILEAAIGLGRSHVAAVNRLALLDGVEVDDILDLHEIFDERIGVQIALSIQKRVKEIEIRLKSDSPSNKKDRSNSTPVTSSLILQRQAEILYSAPVFRTIFIRDDPIRSTAAKVRLAARQEQEQRKRERRAEQNLRSMRGAR